MDQDIQLARKEIAGTSQGKLRSFLRAMSAVIWKDLSAELRSRELLSAMLVFALLVILIFNFALDLDVEARFSVTSGVLWVTFAFAPPWQAIEPFRTVLRHHVWIDDR